MQRIKSLDLARGFTVLFIPIVHSVMLYGNSSVYKSVFGNVLAFIAEWPGAQVFMLLMGISFSLSRKKSLRATLLRSLWLLVAGYLLNVIKFVIPYCAGLLPPAFLHDMECNSWKSLFLIGDILHFAAIALIVLYFTSKLREHPVITILLAFAVCFLSPQVWDIDGRNAITDHIFQLAGDDPPETYFPLFPWLVFPLAGSVIGYYIKEAGNKAFSFVLPAGLGLMIAGFCAGTLGFDTNVSPAESFYRPGPWQTIIHLGFASAWVAGWHFITLMVAKARISANNFFFRFLEFLSKRITLIYLIQWPVICWMLPVFGYHELGIWESAVVGVDVTLFSFLASAAASPEPPPKEGA